MPHDPGRGSDPFGRGRDRLRSRSKGVWGMDVTQVRVFPVEEEKLKACVASIIDDGFVVTVEHLVAALDAARPAVYCRLVETRGSTPQKAGAMMLVSPRSGRSQADSGPPGIVDVHAHWHPQPYVDAMIALGRTGGPLARNPLNVDLDRRLEWMDEHGVETHCLTILTPAVQWAPGDVGAHLARIVNDAAIEAHEAHPTRFIAGVATPVQDPRRSLEELNRVAGNPAFRGVHLPNAHNGEDYIFEPEFEPDGLAMIAVPFELGDAVEVAARELYYTMGDSDLF